MTCEYILIRDDTIGKDKPHRYNGPYKVLSGNEKWFKVRVQDADYTVCIDMIKPFYTLENENIIETKTYVIDVDALSRGKTHVKGQKWWVYPGDQINVTERLF